SSAEIQTTLPFCQVATGCPARACFKTASRMARPTASLMSESSAIISEIDFRDSSFTEQPPPAFAARPFQSEWFPFLFHRLAPPTAEGPPAYYRRLARC